MSRMSPYGRDVSLSFIRTLDTFPLRAAAILHLNQQHWGGRVTYTVSRDGQTLALTSDLTPLPDPGNKL